MAHFLEHLVFKGGEKYPTYRDVNEAAERIGAVLNAYTSHDLVAFHITARAERARRGRRPADRLRRPPGIDAEELDRERGVVVQEIARANDQPAVMAEHLIDEAAFGDHPLGRPVLGPAEHIRDTFTRDGIVAFRSRRWAPARGGAFVVGNLERPAATTARSTSCSAASRRDPRPSPTSRPRRPSRGCWCASATPTSRTCGCPTARRSTISHPRQRAALAIYSTLLGGSMGSRLFDEIREQRGLAYSVHSIAHAYADVPVLQLSAGPGVGEVRRGLPPDARDRHRAARATDRPRRRSSAPARTRPARARSTSRTAGRSRATPPSRRSSTARTSIPTPRSTRLDEVTFDQVARGRRAASPTSCRWPAWVPTPKRSSRPPDTLALPWPGSPRSLTRRVAAARATPSTTRARRRRPVRSRRDDHAAAGASGAAAEPPRRRSRPGAPAPAQPAAPPRKPV